MKKILILLILSCIVIPNIIALDTLYHDRKYAGHYFYHDSNGNLYYITVCDIGWYSMDYNCHMVDGIINNQEFTCDGERGYCETTDSIMTFISVNNEILHQFRIIDTLNFEIIFTKSNFFKEGEFIHRYSAIPPNPTDSCFHYNTIWDIWYNSARELNAYKVTYNKRNQTFDFSNGKFDSYGFDYIGYLPDTIYKFKEGQYQLQEK